MDADRTQLREVEAANNTTIEAFSGLSIFSIPTLTDTNPQVFPALKAVFPSDESMETATEEAFGYHQILCRRY